MLRRVSTFVLALSASLFVHAQPVPTVASALPDGAILIVRGQRLLEAYRQFKATPFGDVILKGPIADYLRETGKLAEMAAKRAEFQTIFGVDPLKTLAALGGDEAVFAVYPVRDRREPHVALILRGADGFDAAATVTPLIDTLVTAGELTAATGAGDSPYRHFRNRQGEEIVIGTKGPASLLTNSSDLAKRIADQAAGGGWGSALENERLRDACRDLVEDADLAAFIDIEPLRAMALENEANLPPPARRMLPLLKALKGIGMALDVHEHGVSGRARVAFDSSLLPPQIKAWHEESPQPAFLPRRLPRGQVIGGALVHMRPSVIAQAAFEQMPESTRQQAKGWLAGVESVFFGGKSILADLLPALGPEFGLIATDLDPTDGVPGELSLVVQVTNETGRGMLASLVRSLYGMSQLAGGPGEADKHTFVDGDAVVTLTRQDRGLTPTVSVTPTALILSTSVTAVKTLQVWLTQEPADNLGAYAPSFKGGLGGLDMNALGQWMRRNLEVLAQGKAAKDGQPLEQAKRELGVLADFFALHDALVIHGVSGPDAYETVVELSIPRP